MRKAYDPAQARRRPVSPRPKQSVTIRLDTLTVAYFKRLAAESRIPYQTLINLYLRDCALQHRKLALKWKPARGGMA